MPHRVRPVSEVQDLRALAHPLRLRVLASLRLDGPATASELARRLDVSSGLTSYHLRALADRGFVEDDPDHADAGRERWWRTADEAHGWAAPDDAGEPAERAGRVEATRALNREVARLFGQWLEAWAVAEPELEEPWRRAVTMFDRWLRLTPERLAELTADVEAVLDRYETGVRAADEPGAERVAVIFAAYRSEGVVP